MYLLKTELRGPQGQRVLSSLPCPESELTLWLAASQRHISSQKLGRLIRRNPALFLIAVSRAVDCTGAPIQSTVQLLSRLEHCFLESQPVDTAMGHVIEVTQIDGSDDNSFDDVSIQEAIKEFYAARTQNQLIKSLRKTVQRFNKHHLDKVDRPKKSQLKEVIDSMFVDTFRIDRMKTKELKWPVLQYKDDCQYANAALLGLMRDRQSSKACFNENLLNAKLSAMKQLAYGASHEINNPLANIATRAQTMLADESEPDRRFQLAVIHEQAMRAHDMISDMMLFAHPPSLRRESIDVRMLISSLIRECESNLLPLVSSGATVSATIGHGVGRAVLDPTQCKVALSSLIQNAAESIRHDKGEIGLHVSSTEKEICFAVSDNGVGIDEAVKQHLFDPFYSGREAGRGLGFGLSKSWRIAKLHGGNLTHRVDCQNLRTVFEMRIPLA